MRAALLAALGLSLACRSAATAPPPRADRSCPYEENCGCLVPGISDRWRAAYCMFVSETDDFLNEDVQACFRNTAGQPAGVRSDCARNAHWKDAICEGLRRDGERERAEQCARRDFIPRAVREGVQ